MNQSELWARVFAWGLICRARSFSASIARITGDDAKMENASRVCKSNLRPRQLRQGHPLRPSLSKFRDAGRDFPRRESQKKPARVRVGRRPASVKPWALGIGESLPLHSVVLAIREE